MYDQFDWRIEYPKKVGEVQKLEKRLDAERAHVEELKKTIERLDHRLRDEMIVHLTELSDYRDALRIALETLDRPECDECDGTGGGRIYREERYSPYGFVPPEHVHTGFGDPNVQPCEECMGTGRETR